MFIIRSEEEVDEIIKNMVERTKGRYLTQGVSFNKTCPRQMQLLKYALMSSASFSGLSKEMLAMRFGGASEIVPQHQPMQDVKPKIKSVGNFI